MRGRYRCESCLQEKFQQGRKKKRCITRVKETRAETISWNGLMPLKQALNAHKPKKYALMYKRIIDIFWRKLKVDELTPAICRSREKLILRSRADTHTNQKYAASYGSMRKAFHANCLTILLTHGWAKTTEAVRKVLWRTIRTEMLTVDHRRNLSLSTISSCKLRRP